MSQNHRLSVSGRHLTDVNLNLWPKSEISENDSLPEDNIAHQIVWQIRSNNRSCKKFSILSLFLWMCTYERISPAFNLKDGFWIKDVLWSCMIERCWSLNFLGSVLFHLYRFRLCSSTWCYHGRRPATKEKSKGQHDPDSCGKALFIFPKWPTNSFPLYFLTTMVVICASNCP